MRRYIWILTTVIIAIGVLVFLSRAEDKRVCENSNPDRDYFLVSQDGVEIKNATVGDVIEISMNGVANYGSWKTKVNGESLAEWDNKKLLTIFLVLAEFVD